MSILMIYILFRNLKTKSLGVLLQKAPKRRTSLNEAPFGQTKCLDHKALLFEQYRLL